MSTNSHTMQHVNDSHRLRYYYGKCVDCLVIVERAYCLDDAEFMHLCSCGAAADTIKLVSVREI